MSLRSPVVFNCNYILEGRKLSGYTHTTHILAILSIFCKYKVSLRTRKLLTKVSPLKVND